MKKMSLTVLMYLIGAFLLILNVMYLKSCKNPVLKGIYGVLSGVVAAIPTGFVLSALGYAYTINYLTLAIGALLGIPGVILSAVYVLCF